ncbi:hypothetical protein SUDANB132_03994 [Streptomyces sp. enrichment culture]
MLGEDLSLVLLRNTLRGPVIPFTTRDGTMTDPVPARNRTEIIRPGGGGSRRRPRAGSVPAAREGVRRSAGQASGEPAGPLR